MVIIVTTTKVFGAEPSKIFFDSNIILEQDRITQTDLGRNNNLTWYHNGNAGQGIQNIIRNTKQFLFINLLALSCDESTEPIISLLEKKAKEGVDIRINLNRMYALGSGACHKRLENAGIQIQKSKTHSSYYTNEAHQLLIGSQSLAKMFLLSDGKNGWDRDSMLWLEGPAATDALRDFLSLWKNTGAETVSAESMHKFLTFTLNEEIQIHKRGITSPKPSDKGLCRFVAQHPDGELRALQHTMDYFSGLAQKHIRFSGVKISYGDRKKLNSPFAAHRLLEKLKGRSQAGLTISYFGNGLEGGNGELTMILKEIRDNLAAKNWPFFAQAVDSLMNWDSQRTTKEHFKNYAQFTESAKTEILTHFQFLHYKVWNFDDAALLITSANLTDDSFDKFSESGVICFDQKLIREWNSTQDQDRSNSKMYSSSIVPAYK